ncbi:hypothetical protein Pelo_13910 [Pelomyxa schiedti]|nr:hypothetical protein Pelo_13910 [Pelomyxa schiedti]
MEGARWESQIKQQAHEWEELVKKILLDAFAEAEAEYTGDKYKTYIEQHTIDFTLKKRSRYLEFTSLHNTGSHFLSLRTTSNNLSQWQEKCSMGYTWKESVYP